MSTESVLKTRLNGDIDVVTLGRLLVPVALVVGWHALAVAVGEFALATPAETAAELVGGVQQGWLVPNLARTMTELAVAYGLVVVAGVWIGVALGSNEFWNDVFEPVLLGVYSIPKVTLFPLFLFVFQLGMDSKIAFGWFHGVFPVAILTMSAMESIREEHLQVARSLRLTRLQTFREIVVPSILPGLVIGLRLGFNLTFLGVVLGEMFAARSGLGYTLVEFMVGSQVARMLAVIVVLVGVATAVNLVSFAVERYVGADDADGAEMRM
ncbi:MAG: ABC transporter permease [Halolamina sp.]